MTALFTTERLSVRKFIPDDYDDLADILTDTEVTYFEPYETFTRETSKVRRSSKSHGNGNLSLLQGNPERSGHGSSNQREESLDVWF